MSNTSHKPRSAALVGPYLAGKTSLLEALLFSAGAITRKGSVKEGGMVGDSVPEAKDRTMSTEPNIATCDYLGEAWTLIDCPGSVELSQDAQNALMVADVAVVVVEADTAKAMAVGPTLKFLDDHGIPHVIFINKMDSPGVGVKATVEALQAVSERPLLLREIPIRDGDQVVGFVDLVSEKAYRWSGPGKPSEAIDLPGGVAEREAEARSDMLEALADFDDHLLEELLEEINPPKEEVYDDLSKDLAEDLIVPVFFGSGEGQHGLTRLWKALRHEVPNPDAAAERLGIDTASSEALAQVFKTVHAQHSGKLSIARVWRGELTDGMTVNGSRIGGIYSLLGGKQTKIAKAGAGEVVALGRLDDIKTGDVLSPGGNETAAVWPEPLKPLFALSIHAQKREDEVKLMAALGKICDEDTSLSVEQSADTGELLLWGQGEVHVKIALDRLKNRFNLSVTGEKPQVPYKETVRKAAQQRSRHKKQSGGHGEFGEVQIEIKPLGRGEGFAFTDTVTGGSVPKNYIPAVEAGAREYLARGPLGFPVVDIAVNLSDGQFHAVDSSDMAFRKATQQAMRDAMPNCSPVLLEPINEVRIAIPTDFTSKVQRLASGRRGQILGFDAKDGWKGWDEVVVQMPQAEMHDLIIELRSLTQGIGTFDWRFDHLQEFSGKQADQIIAARKERE